MEENRILPGLFSIAPKWIRFNRYELTEGAGGICVIPNKEAEMEYYRPFDCFPEILRAFIEMAKELKSNSPETKDGQTGDQRIEISRNIDYQNGKAIIRFVNRYGLLGLFWKAAYSFTEAETRVKPIQYYYLFAGHESDMSYNEYAKIFFPRSKQPYPKVGASRQDFWKEYAEPVVQTYALASEFLSHVKDWEGFQNSEVLPEDEWVNGWTWADRFRGLGVWPIGLGLQYDGAWQLGWKFQSLYDALWIMWLNDITAKKQLVRHCLNCNKVFIAKSPKAAYCSTTCGVNVRVRRHRGKAD